MSAYTDEQFVREWMKSHKNNAGQSPIAEALNISRQMVSLKAIALRKRGVKLPQLSKSPYVLQNTSKEYIAKLNKIVNDEK